MKEINKYTRILALFIFFITLGVTAEFGQNRTLRLKSQ
jgi:hypothetical protein